MTSMNCSASVQVFGNCFEFISLLKIQYRVMHNVDEKVCQSIDVIFESIGRYFVGALSAS